MPEFSGITAGPSESGATDTANSRGTALTSNATPNTKATSFTTLIASTAYVSGWIGVKISSFADSGLFLVDIAKGAASSEQVIIGNIHYEASGPTRGFTSLLIPLLIPQGERISARCQSSNGADVCEITVDLFAITMAGPPPCGLVTTYGADTGDSGATMVDPGTSANAEGAWQEITSSTTHPIRWLSFVVGHNGAGVTADIAWLLDLGRGAGGAEQVIVADMPFSADSAGDTVEPRTYNFPIFVPAGERLAVRARCNNTTAANRQMDVVLYGAS